MGCSPWGRQESDTTEQLHFHFSFSCIGEGNGNPLQRSCLENPRDGGAWWAAVYGVTQSWTRLKRLSSSSSRDKHKGKHFNLVPSQRNKEPVSRPHSFYCTLKSSHLSHSGAGWKPAQPLGSAGWGPTENLRKQDHVRNFISTQNIILLYSQTTKEICLLDMFSQCEIKIVHHIDSIKSHANLRRGYMNHSQHPNSSLTPKSIPISGQL